MRKARPIASASEGTSIAFAHAMRRAVACFAAASIIAACNGQVSSDPQSTSSTSVPRAGCSDGAPYTEASRFGDAYSSGGETESYEGAHECVPRCGDTSRARYGPTISALPSGACPYEGEKCTMGAMFYKDCPDGTTTYCSYSGFGCTCTGGQWSCAVLLQGASMCLCSFPDGGR